MITVEAEGEGRLAQLLDIIYVGDWMSYYLALDNDVDPGPIDAIMQLKAALERSGIDTAASRRLRPRDVAPRSSPGSASVRSPFRTTARAWRRRSGRPARSHPVPAL